MQVERKPFQRLSKSVQPINYKLKFQPNLVTFTFAGEATIDIEVKREEVQRITVNCVDIDVLSVKYVSSELEVEPSKIVYKAERETVTFLFDNALPLGAAKLNIVFNGELNDKLKGFYRSKYTTPSGEERYSAVTQLESTHARNAFPCWDEPAIKATFEVTMVAPKDRVVLSNMDELSREDHDDGELQVVHFKKTPIMSTYLLAFVVGEYDFIEERSSDGVLVRVYTPTGKTEQGRFALEVAVKTLPFYSDYFSIPYPLPKLDLIAIPDFDAGAMENWGLVTYRETCLLIDEVESSAARKQRVALVVGHELAHQWFGNLTTMEWWTHLWLNEGFASWVEYLCVDHCCPNFHIWTQFVVSTMTPALKLDSLNNSHPIEVPVGHPSEVDEIFDAISYDKGASIIQMLHGYLGTEDFKTGLHTYLTEFSYKNTFTEDLWRHLEVASKKPVTDVMSTWTKQMGYPVLSVSLEKTNSQSILKISQKKFNADGSPDALNSLWAIPITLATSKDPSAIAHTTLLNERDMVLILDGPPADWVKLNPGLIGFYRTLYSTEMLEALIPGIRSLSAVDRLGIENDLFALAVAGYTSTTDFLRLLSGYQEEADYIVWSDLISNLSQLGIIMQYTDVFDKYKEFIKQLCKPALEKLGIEAKEGEDHTASLLRSLLIARLGRYGDANVIEECQRRFKQHVDGCELIHADIRSAVYSTVATHGTEETIDELIQLYRNSTHMEEKMRIVTCLGLNEDPSIITKVLQFAISDEVKSQDTISVMAGCTSSLVGRTMTWQFTKDNWELLHTRYSSGFLLIGLIRVTTKYFATKSDADDIMAFFKEHDCSAATRTINQSLESIELNRKWLERDQADVVAWLNC